MSLVTTGDTGTLENKNYFKKSVFKNIRFNVAE